MTAKEKQNYLKTEVLEAGYEAEVFINFLEGKRDDGSDIDVWRLEELIDLVSEFKQLMEGGETIQRRKTTQGQQLAVFGG
jgi:hypothetical protein